MSGKPEGERAGWRTLSTDYPYEDEFQKLRRDRVEVAGRGETIFAYQERPDGVLIVPVTSGGEILMIRQYRYAVDAWCLEVPAGGTQDTGDAPLETVARKELREEIGAEGGDLRYIGWFYATGSQSDETCHVFLALGVERRGQPEREPTETMEMLTLPIDEALKRARGGQMRSGPSTLALLLCEEPVRRWATRKETGMAETNSDDAPVVGIAPMGDAGDTSSAAGDALGIPGERNEGDATAENAPGGPSAGNTIGDTVGTGPAGGPQDTRIDGNADV